MLIIDCTDETFDSNFTIEYKLSIQAGLDGFSFCILDDIRKKYILFRHFQFSLSNNSFLLRKIKEIIKNEEILGRMFKDVTIGFVSPKFTVVPAAFNETDEQAIINLNMEITNDEAISSFNSIPYSAKIIYTYPKVIADYLKSKFNNPVLMHPIKPLFSFLSQKAKHDEIQALISVNKKFFTILISEGEKLLFANSFRYLTNMDFIYYMLNVFKILPINVPITKIFITGEIDEDSHLVNFLKTQFIKIEFLKLSKNYQYSYTFLKFQPYKFVSVINSEL